MQLYLRITGGKDLKNFWKMSPAELTAWAEARAESGAPADDGFGDMLTGEEIED